MQTQGAHIKWESWIKDCSLLIWYLIVWSRTDAILNVFLRGHLFEVWDQDDFGITVGSSNKMARDETKMTAFNNRLTTRWNAFGFAQKFVCGKRICWTKCQCVNLVRMISNMNIFGAVFDAWFRLMLAALVGSRKCQHRTNDWHFYDGVPRCPVDILTSGLLLQADFRDPTRGASIWWKPTGSCFPCHCIILGKRSDAPTVIPKLTRSQTSKRWPHRKVFKMASVLNQTLKYQVSKLQSFIHDTYLMWGPPGCRVWMQTGRCTRRFHPAAA